MGKVSTGDRFTISNHHPFHDGLDKILRKLKMSITTEHDCVLRLVPASNTS